ncbi:MAG: hypothetical protein AAGE76_03520 [Pseudomonadota bacterium]
MKKVALTVAALSLTTPAFAGNVETFVAPVEPPVTQADEPAPLGSSLNAAVVVPLLAVVLVATALAVSN